MKDIERGLTDGLLGGFAGEGHLHDFTRNGIKGKGVVVPLVDGNYQDGWLVGERTGGGQEVLVLGDQKYTRVYAGGVSDQELLDKLNLTPDEINDYLVRKLKELGDATRLSEDCVPEPDGKWQYLYNVIASFESSNTTMGVETIQFDGFRVHSQGFAMCPII